MSTVRLVEEWKDIATCPKLSDKEKIRVGTLLNETSWERVVWVPEWVLQDKTEIEPVDQSDSIVVGDVESYSGKAWRVWQPHRKNEFGEPNDFVPKSEVIVFERSPSLERVRMPQVGLRAFENPE